MASKGGFVLMKLIGKTGTVVLLLLCVLGAVLFGQGSKLIINPIEKEGVNVWVDKDFYAEGENLVIHIRSEQDGYLIVYDLLSSGQAAKLFPNPYTADNHILAEKEYTIPSSGAPYDLQVSIPPGTSQQAEETIWVVVTEKPTTIADIRATNSDTLTRQVRDLLLTQEEDGGWWASATTSFQYTSIASVSGTSLEDRIALLNKEITDSGANWTASKTSLSALPIDQLWARCGTEPEDTSLLAPTPTISQRTLDTLGSHFSWRNVYGRDWTTPIKRQGPCGSCWIFGPVAVVEALHDIRSRNPFDSAEELLAEQCILSCGPSDGCGGGDPNKAFEFIRNAGIVPTVYCPYSANDTLDCRSEPNVHRQIATWGKLSSSSVTVIKAALLKYGPLAAAMRVYAEFADYRKGVYEHVSGEKWQGHCVTIVGWEDNNKAWICKNSWGVLWGESGWFRIKWGECGIDSWLVLAACLGSWGNQLEVVRFAD